MLEEFDSVRLRKALPEGDVPLGSTGAVVMVYRVPSIGYEVEFFDKSGRSLGTYTTDEDHLERA
jgi:hypothetical protein